jgi:hypothetical protein
MRSLYDPQKEGRISLALQALLQGQIQSLRAAACSYDIPYTTLNKRYHGITPRRDTQPNSQKLTRMEEEVLL